MDTLLTTTTGLHGLRPSHARATAHQYVCEHLRYAILSGALPGGTRLVQADLAQQLQVSTTPVREALRDLASEGLVAFDPHRGAVVHRPSVAELREVYELRRVLEPLAILKAADLITAEELGEAAQLQEQMEVVQDPADWAQLNWQFHAVLLRAANSPRLITMVKSLQDAAAIYVAHSLSFDRERIRHGNREHRMILTALRRQQGQRAADVLVKHLDGTLSAVLREEPG